MPEISCGNCGRVVYKRPSKISKHSFCCSECYYVWQRGKEKNAGQKIVKECEVCGKEFRAKKSNIARGWDRFCSVECFNIYQTSKVEIYCETCGKPFMVIKSRAKKARFCSKECVTAWRRTQTGDRNHGWKGGQTEFVCENCGKHFFSYASSNSNKFCSHDCYNEYRGWQGGQTKKECLWCGKTFYVYNSQKGQKFCSKKCVYKSKRDRVTLICEVCGKEFVVKIGMANQRFCSKKCKGKWQSKVFVGPKCPSWKGGTSRLPYHYTFRTVRKSIRKRDNYTCAICNKKGRCVHHIDYDKMNTERTNLITLCKSCHSKTNTDRKHWQALLSPLVRRRENGT